MPLGCLYWCVFFFVWQCLQRIQLRKMNVAVTEQPCLFMHLFVCAHGTVVSRNWCERQKWLVVYKVVKAYTQSYGMVHTFRVTYEVQRLCLEMLYAVNLSLNLLVQNWFTVLFIFCACNLLLLFFFLAHFLFLIILKWRHWYPLWNTIAML